MASSPYRTRPEATDKMPKGIGYILTNEAAERFSFYGMSSILMVFMTKYLMGSDGALQVMGDEDAKTWFHIFTAAVYCTPLIGALISCEVSTHKQYTLLSTRPADMNDVPIRNSTQANLTERIRCLLNYQYLALPASAKQQWFRRAS